VSLSPTFYARLFCTKVFFAGFTLKDPKGVKNTVKPSVFFVLLGSVRVKAARKMLVKLTRFYLRFPIEPLMKALLWKVPRACFAT